MELLLTQSQQGLAPARLFLYLHGTDEFSMIHQSSFDTLAQTYPTEVFLKLKETALWRLTPLFMTRGLPTLITFENGTS